MSATKRELKSKFLSKDMSELLEDSQFVTNKGQKRQKIVPEEEDISKLLGMNKMNAKKKQVEATVDAKETRQKLLEVLGNQMDARFVQLNFLYCYYFFNDFWIVFTLLPVV